MQATKKKLVRRKRRRQHIRKNLKGSSDRPRLTVYRSAKHIYCQAIDDFNGVTLVSASSMAKDVSRRNVCQLRKRRGCHLSGDPSGDAIEGEGNFSAQFRS